MLFGTTLVACGSNASLSGGRQSNASVTPSSSTTSPGRSTVETGPIAVVPSTTIVKYPNPYRPSYSNLDALIDDSLWIVIAQVEPEQSTDGSVYPLLVEQGLGGLEPRSGISVLPAEFNAAHLTVGATYLFFYGSDAVDNTNCIVGGVRGVFS
jgi:hypothetical protein